MHKKDLLLLIAINLIYLTILFIFQRQIFTHQFDPSLIDTYLKSQDITHEISGRVFLSDSEIHEAAGYLYAKGEDPSQYNFQHPPFIKYLYGFSTLLFNNPYIAQMTFGIALICGVYMLGIKLYKSTYIATFASFLMVVDPLFTELSTSLLLDLGQATLLLFYIISFIWYKKYWLLQGILLGLLAGSKFWGGTTLFIISILIFYSFIKKGINYKNMLLQLLVAGVTFCLFYIKTFIDHAGMFNIVFFELRTLKYWLNHSVSSMFGASFILFVSGYVSTWWGNEETIRVSDWTLLWPITLVISLYRTALLIFIKKMVTHELLISAIPLLYLGYLGIQAPFTRYFIIILPFLYITASAFILRRIKLEK